MKNTYVYNTPDHIKPCCATAKLEATTGPELCPEPSSEFEFGKIWRTVRDKVRDKVICVEKSELEDKR